MDLKLKNRGGGANKLAWNWNCRGQEVEQNCSMELEWKSRGGEANKVAGNWNE